MGASIIFLTKTSRFLCGLGILALALVLGVNRRGWAAPAASPCPDVSRGEKEEDCPWAYLGRAGIQTPKDLSRLAPEIAKQLRADSAHPDLMALWGRSINFDENAKAAVIPAGLYRSLATLAGLPSPLRAEKTTAAGPVVHAGVEHTYGYLFSNLVTPYGFKRARWVRPTLDQGLGLPEKTIAPVPAHGTLLGNLTYLLGKAVLADDPSWKKFAAATAKDLTPELLAWDPKAYERSDLVETVELPGKRKVTVTLHTTLIKFKTVLEPSGARLLIYWIEDSRDAGPRLITAFPVAESFLDTVFKPESLGEGKTVQTRYNGYVEGLSGHPLPGTRKAVRARTGEAA